jgi:hypothetical protein
MIRQRAAASTPLLGASAPERRVSLLRFGLRSRDCLLEIFQSQGKLSGLSFSERLPNCMRWSWRIRWRNRWFCPAS